MSKPSSLDGVRLLDIVQLKLAPKYMVFAKELLNVVIKKFLQIGAKGAEFIADMLKYNTTISVLDLRANGLRDEVRICGIVFFIPKN